MDKIKKKADQPYVTGTNQKIIHVHNVKECSGEHCVIHNPSSHRMSKYPTHWRGDRGIMERICPHGVGHPDPDMLEHIRRTKGKKAADIESVHGCDGCCIERRSGDYGKRRVKKL